MTTNTSATVDRVAELGGASNSGIKIGYLSATARAAQNDTITISNASEILAYSLKDADGTDETATLATNVLTMTRSDTTNVFGIIIYR